MNSDAPELSNLLIGMRTAYAKGENVMEFARKMDSTQNNSAISALIAYDLQAGSYIADARKNPAERERWCSQLAEILKSYITEQSTILEVGCGEATTLEGVLQQLNHTPCRAFGFDISWSRCAYGQTWLAEKGMHADLFVADLFDIPLDDSSIDVVYTSHSIEPNGGREKDAIKELMRVARRAVILVEPIYELASVKAQERMRKHGYVRNLKQTAENLGATVSEYRPLEYIGNPLNPSGLLVIEKLSKKSSENFIGVKWRCPLTHTPLIANHIGYYSQKSGIVYPTLVGIPLLHSSHAVVASAFENINIKAGNC